MLIAKNYSSAKWKSLKLNEQNETDWQIAIDILNARLNERYIEPVNILIESEKSLEPQNRKFGFTILAIDLLLMETLQAFKEGLGDTSGKSRTTFKNFLEKSTYFSKFFSDDNSREKFYSEFRCGILHQAEVQSDEARVWSVGELYKEHGNFYSINRNAVHKNLKLDLEDYITFLRNPANAAERQLFKKKMDAIAR